MCLPTDPAEIQALLALPTGLIDVWVNVYRDPWVDLWVDPRDPTLGLTFSRGYSSRKEAYERHRLEGYLATLHLTFQLSAVSHDDPACCSIEPGE